MHHHRNSAARHARCLLQAEHFLDAHGQHRRLAWLVVERNLAAAGDGDSLRGLAGDGLNLLRREPSLNGRSERGAAHLVERTAATAQFREQYTYWIVAEVGQL